MTAVTAVPAANHRLRLAVGLAQLGYRVFPLKPDTKEPATLHGFKEATSDVEQVEAWWERNPSYNIGLACGMQDNGKYLVVIDIDAKHGGVLAWKQLTRDNGGTWQRYMPIHKTPRAGFHILGQVDPSLRLNAANGFPRGIDTRGDGGYVVVPDSRFVDTETGEIGNYVCTENNLWVTEPGTFPDWVIELWQSGPQRESFERHPSSQPVDADSPLAWMKANIDWFAEIQRDKFTLLADFGGEVRWTREGKSRGNSLSLHLAGNGCVVVWSDNCPEWMTDHRCGQWTSDGHWSLNGFQYICARDFGGDVAAAMSHIRRELMPPPPARSSNSGPATDGEPDGSPIDAMCLPDWFWLERPWLTHLRQSAWSVGSVPESILAAALARIAVMTSPKWMIPAIIHRAATLDLITVLVGHTGSGKSGPMGRAADILPCKFDDRRFDLGIGSGEGMIESYYGMRPGPDGKKERAKVYNGIHFVVDEGAIFATLGGRGGWTGIDRILTAWSGGNLSTPNAKAETFRHIERGTYRFAMTMAIQIELADGLWANNNTAQGFTGRLTMFSGLSRTVPEEQDWPEDPGPIKINLPMDHGPHQLSYPAWFVSEVRAADHVRKTLTKDPDPLSAHRNLQRCKLAGIFALVEGRFAVDDRDIALASAVVDTSDTVRAWLMAQARSSAERSWVETAGRKGMASALESEAADKQILGKTVDVVSAKLKERDMSRGDLRRYITGSKREYLDAALAVLEGMGKVEGGSGQKWRWIG